MSTGETFGRTIQLFLVDGKPTGLRKVTIHGWTGLLFVSGASAFGDLTAREEEVNRTGVYILSGPDPEQPGGTRVYIGSGKTDRIAFSDHAYSVRHHQRKEPKAGTKDRRNSLSRRRQCSGQAA